MQVRDIIAIARRDLREIEAGFRALIGYPSEQRIDGATPLTLMAALDATCDALEHDTSIVPSGTLDLLLELEVEMETGTYAAGAAAVQARRDLWEWRYSRLCRTAA